MTHLSICSLCGKPTEHAVSMHVKRYFVAPHPICLDCGELVLDKKWDILDKLRAETVIGTIGNDRTHHGGKNE